MMGGKRMGTMAKLLGARIRQLRRQRAWSQENLAYKAGMNTSYLGQVERGEKSPTVDSLEKISSALDVDLEELFAFGSVSEESNAFAVIDKIILELKGRTAYEQEAVYAFIKQLLHFRDKK